MTIIHRAAIAAVLATCAVAPAIAAGPVRSPVSARISTADLDLTRAAGRAGLHRRLSVAAQRACGLAQAQWHERRDAERCYREMMADGAGKIAALTPAQRLELASIERR